MASFSWIQIDAVRYDWDGQQIGCNTEVGYVSQLPGARLEGLEIEAEGQVLGRLNVDFAQGEWQFEPTVPMDEVAVTILYGQAGEPGRPLLLQEGAQQAAETLQDFLIEESGPLLLWQSLTAEDQSCVLTNSSEVLFAEEMLSDESPCLPESDLFTQQQHMAQDLALLLDTQPAVSAPLGLDEIPPGLDF